MNPKNNKINIMPITPSCWIIFPNISNIMDIIGRAINGPTTTSNTVQIVSIIV